MFIYLGRGIFNVHFFGKQETSTKTEAIWEALRAPPKPSNKTLWLDFEPYISDTKARNLTTRPAAHTTGPLRIIATNRLHTMLITDHIIWTTGKHLEHYLG